MGPPALPPSSSSSNRSSTPQRLTRSWSQSVASLGSCLVSHLEVKRQEAIHELYMGEVGMVLDLELVTNTYRSSLLQLNILSEQEIECIFGDLNALLALHSSLRDKLQVPQPLFFSISVINDLRVK
jgi:Rho guanine nucleotide exchange factor 3/8